MAEFKPGTPRPSGRPVSAVHARDPMERLRKQPREVAQLMDSVSLFDELSSRERALLAEMAEVVRCAGGTKVFEPGDDGKYLYCVLQGRLELRTSSSTGIAHAVREIPPGRVAGLDAVLTQQPYHLTCVAIENTAALRFHTAQLHQLLSVGTPAAIKLFVALRTELGVDIRAATLQVVRLLEAASTVGVTQQTGFQPGTPTSSIEISALPGGNQTRGS